MNKSGQSPFPKNEISQEIFSTAQLILEEIKAGEPVLKSIRRHPLIKGGYVSKHNLVTVYRQLMQSAGLKMDVQLLARIRMKPMRSLSGVSTITVLTKPYPCPGECIFCPEDAELPKSYLRREPGAARAYQNQFDPYRQVSSRLDSYHAIGHPTDKIELLILGGCWTAYPADYQDWFILRCLDALNKSDSPDLKEAQRLNQHAAHRNVGLVVETRPDEINPQRLTLMRRQGVTKIQLGAQSFDDRILLLNRRGHTSQDTLHATAMLRAAGFKIVLHWMPNLLGATLESDRADFQHLWSDGYAPDELKIYPTQLIQSSALYQLWLKKEYTPYTTEELIHLIADIKPGIPPYCRVNRIVRDIPSDYIVAGNKRSSLRQDILAEMVKRDTQCRCIRCREVRGHPIDINKLIMEDLTYSATCAEEHFINYSTPENRLAGYLRLSLPAISNQAAHETWRDELYQLMPELQGAAIVREVHVYGQSLEIGSDLPGASQHIGLGTSLLQRSEEITRERGFQKLIVIAAVGTREYYRKRGFSDSEYYMVKPIS